MQDTMFGMLLGNFTLPVSRNDTTEACLGLRNNKFG
jgi:hypothetical protein